MRTGWKGRELRGFVLQAEIKTCDENLAKSINQTALKAATEMIWDLDFWIVIKGFHLDPL